MEIGNKLTSDEILAKLNQASRKARIISIGLTLFLVLILGIVVFFTYTAYQNLNDLHKQATDELASVQGLRGEKANLEDTIYRAKQKAANNPNCKETENILAEADTTVDPTLQPVNQKTPAPVVPPPNNQTPNSTPKNNSPSTVYVQITEETQRESAKKVIQQLAGGNFKFPGIELVKRKIDKTEVRYFREEDKARAIELANKLVEKEFPATAVSPYKTNSPLEIWFSNGAFTK